MAAPPMDPQYEQRLRDEVIYLHSLWHQGPPRVATSASASAPIPAGRRHLQPSKSTQFKKEKKHRGKKSKNTPNIFISESNPSTGAEWPCPIPTSPPSTTGWPSFEPTPNQKPISLSPEEQSKLAAKHAHKQALKAVHEFLRSNNDDDSDTIGSSSDEDDELMEDDDGREEYSFFFKLFKEDAGLKEVYEKNYAKGEFNCLVCGAVGGKKTGKKFKGCLALVQHSINIAKTKKRRAHRAFGQAVCKVLGWDIDQLSTIVSLLSDKSSEAEGNVNSDNKESSLTFVNNANSLEGSNAEALQEHGSIDTGIVLHDDEPDANSLGGSDDVTNLEDHDMVHPHNVEKTAAEELTSVNNPLACLDADKNLENLDVVCPHNMKEPAAESLTSNSDTNLENLGIVPAHNIEEPAADGLSSVPLNENNAVGDEIQHLQKDNDVAVHTKPNEVNKTEDSELEVVTEQGT